MKKFLTYLFVGMGVLFLLQLIGLGYLFVVDPLNIKPFLFSEQTNSSINSTNSTSGEQDEVQGEGEVSTEGQTLPVSNLSPEQQRALQFVGVEPEAIPQSFTEEQLRCFIGVLGEARVNEIKAGAIPSMSEYYQAKDCI